MIKIGKKSGKVQPERRERVVLSVSATGDISNQSLRIVNQSLRIVGFSSVKRGQNHRVLKVQYMYNFKPETQHSVCEVALGRDM